MQNELFPWHNPWREELLTLLGRIFSARKPALRRSLRAEFLFATDLPRCAAEAACRRWIQEATAAGWDCRQFGDWIEIRRADGLPPEGWFPDSPTGEASCVAVLLRQHPEEALSREELHTLLKAREAGPGPWEEACRTLHRSLAARLRERQALHGGKLHHPPDSGTNCI